MAQQRQYLDISGVSKIFELIAGKYATIASLDDLVALVGAAAKGDEEAKSVLERVAALETLAGADSVADQIKDAVEALDVTDLKSTGGAKVELTLNEVDGKVTSIVVAETDIASAQDLADEIERAEGAEGELQDAIDAEAEAARAAEQALSNRIGAAAVVEGETVVTAASGVYSYVDAAVAAVNDGAADIAQDLADEVSAREQAVSDEETRATEAEEALAGRLDIIEGEAEGSIKAAVAAEEDARKAQIGELGKNGEGEDAADHTVKSFVEAKIAEVNGDAEALEARVEANEGNIETLMGADTVEGSVAKALKDAKEYADGLDEAMDARVDALEALHAEGKTVAEEAADAVAAVVADAPEAFDTLVEIAEWIQSSEAGEKGFDAANRIVALETAVGKEAAGETTATGLIADVRALEALVQDGFVALTAKEIEDAFNGKTSEEPAENA